jgi:hypothetical protein
MRDRRRPARLVAALALGVLLLAGCASIPDSGPVEQGDAVADQAPGDVVYTPIGPVADSSQERILRDFIGAGTGPQDNYAVAREFLAEGFADDWDPRASVTVRPGGGSTTRTSDDRLEYAFTASATVDVGGHYVPTTSTVPTTLSYSFVQEDGQWRISDAPDGTVLSPATFQSIFRAHAVYFTTPRSLGSCPTSAGSWRGRRRARASPAPSSRVRRRGCRAPSSRPSPRGRSCR